MKRTGLILTLFVIVKTLCSGDACGMAENHSGLIEAVIQPFEQMQLSRFVFRTDQSTFLNSQLNPDKLDQAKKAATDCSETGSDFSGVSSSKTGVKELRIALQLDKQVIKIPDEGSKTNMGVLFKDLALYEKAIDHYKKSLQTKKRLGDESGEASDLDSLGQVYEAIGDYPNALQQYEQALGIFRKLGKADDEARTLNDIGELQRELGNYAMALDCYQMALAKFKTSSLTKDEAILQNNVGLIYEKLGMHERALESHRMALAMFRKLGNPQDEAAAMLEIAETSLKMGKYDQGIKSSLDALQLMKKAGISTDETAGVVAGYFMDSGKTEEAEALLNKTDNVGSLARLALIKGDFQTASSLYSKELQRQSDNGNHHHKFYVYTGLGKTYQAMKEYPKAQEAFQAAVNASETIASTLAPSDRKRFFDTKINGFEPSEAYKGLALAKFRLDNPEGALSVSDLLKSRRFDAYMSDGGTSRKYGLPRDLLTRETGLVNRMAALRKELNSTDKQKYKTKHDNISVLVNQSENEFSGLIEEIRRRFPAYASIKYPRPFKLTEISINPDDYVIVFSTFNEGIARQLIHDNKIIKSDFINQPLKDLEADVVSFRKNLGDTNLQNFNPALASSLFAFLFKGIIENVPEGVSLRIISDGILNLAPFDALVMTQKTKSSQTEINEKIDPSIYVTPDRIFLGDHFRLSLHQSISSMTMAKTALGKIRPPGNVLALADPIFSTKDDRFDRSAPAPTSDTTGNLLAETARIVNNSESGFGLSSRPMNFSPVFQNLEKIFPGRFILLSGAKADKSDLMRRVSQNSDGFGNVIFGTPVVTTNSCPIVNEPFIALTTAPPGTDGYLSLSDILSLRMPSEMVAVVGSRAGSSDDADSGQGLADMAQAFQYAGAKSVLMSLWDHDPKSSTIFMEKFFAQIKTGSSKQESLKKAKEQVRKEGYEHPHYWSGYTLFGDL